MIPLRKLGRFNPREILHAINSLIDRTDGLQPRKAPGVKNSSTSKGVTQSASKASVSRSNGTSSTVVARWG